MVNWNDRGDFRRIYVGSSALVPSVHVAADGLKASSSLKSAHGLLVSERPEIRPRTYQGELIGQSHLSSWDSVPAGFIRTGFVLSFSAGHMDAGRIPNQPAFFLRFVEVISMNLYFSKDSGNYRIKCRIILCEKSRSFRQFDTLHTGVVPNSLRLTCLTK